MQLNLSKFRKIKEDHKGAVLQHPDGHKIAIAKNKLSPQLNDQLSKLPLHYSNNPTEVPDIEDLSSDNQPEQNASMPEQKSNQPTIIINNGQPQNQPPPNYMNNGTFDFNKFTQQNPEAPLESKISVLEKQKHEEAALAERSAAVQLAEKEKVLKYNALAAERGLPLMPVPGGSPSVPSAPTQPMPGTIPSGAGQNTLNDSNANLGAQEEAAKSLQGGSVQMPDAHPIGAGATVAAPTTGAPIQSAPGMTASDPFGTNAAIQGADEQRQAAVNTGQIESQGAKAASDIYGKSAYDQSEHLAEFERHAEDLHGEINGIVKDSRDHLINPNHYMQSLSTGSRIMTAIGLALGGFSNAINKTGNPMQDFLKHQIDNDINAQMKNQNTRTDLLKAFQDQFHNERDTFDAFKAAHLAITSDQINQQAQKMGDPLAIERARALTGALDKERAQLIAQVAMRQAFTGGGAQGLSGGSKNPGSATGQAEATLNFLRANNDPRAKDYEERLVPGVGLATVPVPADARNKLIAGQDLLNKVADIQKFAEENSGSVDPSVIAQGKVKAAQLQNTFRVASHSGVFKESDQGFIERSIPNDPTAFFAQYRTLPKYRELENQARGEMDATRRGYGLPPLKEYTENPPNLGK